VVQGADIFGRIIVGSQVEGAVIMTLDKWFPTYLQEMEIQLSRNRGQIKEPRSYTTRNMYESFPEDQLPMCVVVSPGLSRPPTSEGDGWIRAVWRIGVGIVVSASEYRITRELGLIYASAVRGILAQQGGLGGLAAETVLVDESYDDEPIIDADRTIMSTYNLYDVQVDQIVNRFMGPQEPVDPDEQPGSQWPTAEHVIIMIARRNMLTGEVDEPTVVVTRPEP
jgi:hypothetical protein